MAILQFKFMATTQVYILEVQLLYQIQQSFVIKPLLINIVSPLFHYWGSKYHTNTGSGDRGV